MGILLSHHVCTTGPATRLFNTSLYKTFLQDIFSTRLWNMLLKQIFTTHLPSTCFKLVTHNTTPHHNPQTHHRPHQHPTPHQHTTKQPPDLFERRTVTVRYAFRKGKNSPFSSFFCSIAISLAEPLHRKVHLTVKQKPTSFNFRVHKS